VVHGRNVAARDALFAFLRSVSLRPLEWTQAVACTGKPSPMIAEILDAAFAEAQAVVVLLTGDDEVRLSPSLWGVSEPPVERDLSPQARPNVLFEAGLALGRSPDNTVFVELGHVKPFSDNAGRHVVRLSNAATTRRDLVNRLRLAGCDADDSGSDWLSAGDFSLPAALVTPSLPAPDPPPSVALGGWLSTVVECAEPDTTSAKDFTCRLLKAGDPFWRFGWQLEITNRSRGPSAYRIECRVLDSNGHELDKDTDQSGVVVNPLETKTFSGAARIDATLAPSAVRAIALVSRSRPPN